jgi:alkylhydroperoxidase family enzyme
VTDTAMNRVPRSELPPALSDQWDWVNGLVDDPTCVEVLGNHPPLAKWYFEQFYGQLFYNGNPEMLVDVRTKELLRLRLSKQHGCRLCNRNNSAACLQAGITQEQIDNFFNPTPALFSDADLAVLDLADQMLIHNPQGRLDQALYARLKRHFSDAQIMELGHLAAVMTGYLKLMFTFDLVPKEDYCPFNPVALAAE